MLVWADTKGPTELFQGKNNTQLLSQWGRGQPCTRTRWGLGTWPPGSLTHSLIHLVSPTPLLPSTAPLLYLPA